MMPNNDLISRKYIIKELLKEREKFPAMVEERYSLGVKIPHKFNQAIRGGIRKALRIVETAPAVDAEPVRHGRWENGGDGIYDTCTYCKESIYMALPMNYCPNSGAKLENQT